MRKNGITFPSGQTLRDCSKMESLQHTLNELKKNRNFHFSAKSVQVNFLIEC